MSTISTTLAATCLAFASLCANAQTAAPGTPPTHPAASGTDTSTATPTTPPTHPAAVSSGATPEAAAAAGKETRPAAGDAKRADSRSTSKPAPSGATERDPASTDSMARENMPKHPAAATK